MPANKTATWVVEVEASGMQVSVRGIPKTDAEIKAMSGGDPFTIEAGDHRIKVSGAGSGMVTVNINGSVEEIVASPVHLGINPMACCIGDRCIMWPPPPAKGWSVEVEASGVDMKVKGVTKSAEEIKAMCGGDELTINVGKHIVKVADAGLGQVSININGAVHETVSSPAHLGFNPMACCIGDRCVMWPPMQESKAWSFDEFEASLPLTMNGETVTAAQIISMAGQNFTLEVGDNEIAFEGSGNGNVTITINTNMKEVAHSPLHINLSKMAVCVGDKCVMWPKASPKAKKAKTETDAEFLKGIEEKVGAAAFGRLRALMNQALPEKAKAHAKEEHHGPVRHPKTKADFDAIIKNNAKVVVDCSAVWCVPCKVIGPQFDKLAEQINDVVFVGVDVQENVAVAREYDVKSLPSFLFFENGTLVNREVGSDFGPIKLGVDKLRAGGATVAEEKKQVVRNSKYDLIVIGGGSGGMSTAKEAAKYGANVAVFDYVKASTQNSRWGLGGTCVNVGCVPKKLMHYGAILGELLHDAEVFGWQVKPEAVHHNWGKLVDNVQGHVKKLNFFYEKGLETANVVTFRNGETKKISSGSVTYYNALAKFTSPTEVSYTDDFGDEGMISAPKIVVSVGGRPHVDDIAKAVAITSDDIFSWKKSPGKTLCVGAGYIALECGGFLTNLGYDTTILVRSVPLRAGSFDRQCVDKMVSSMKKMGTKFMGGIPVKFVKQGDVIEVTIKETKMDGDKVEETGNTIVETFDTVLYATGRGMDTAGLALDAAGVKYEKDGKVKVNEQDQTNIPHIYAIGDITVGSPELTPYAIQVGQLLARRLFKKGCTEVMDHTLIPTTVFTPFEYGRVGMTEEEARKKYGSANVEVYLSEFESLEAGAAHRFTKGVKEDFGPNCLAKLVCVKSEDDRVVGFHFVGPNAGEVTQGYALGLKLGAKKADFDNLVGIHPTDAEVFTSNLTALSSNEEYVSAGGCGGGKCG